MKHTIQITLIVLGIFFITQLIGIGIINEYIDKPMLETEGKVVFEDLPLKFERPEVEEKTSFILIFAAILIGTLLALFLIRFKQILLWKFWFFLAVFITLNVAFKPFIYPLIATLAALTLAFWKIYKPNFYIQNFTELFIYGGLAAIFVPILNVFAAVMVLILISAYDAYAVWKSKHMIKLAKFQTKAKMFAGVIIPYKLPKPIPKNATKKPVKIKTAILGGGDIGFPLLFAGVLFKGLVLTNSISLAFAKVLVVPVFATLALGLLLYGAEKDKFYPAMPTISAGCLIAYGIMYLAGFL